MLRKMNQLEKKLDKIEKIFKIDQIINSKIDNEKIKLYYKINKIPYSLFYSKEGNLHMGISDGGKFHKNDLWKQVDLIHQYIEEIDAKSVLELASGRGTSLIRLSKNNPNTYFKGIDLSKDQLRIARKSTSNIPNITFLEGDFHNLKLIPSSTVDLCFNIEALCYSTDKSKVLKEIKRILKPNGLFILFDGYSTINRKLKPINETAMRLVEVGMAVPYFDVYEDFMIVTKNVGLKAYYEKDYSANIIPSMRRMERLAKYFFLFPQVSRIIIKISPKVFVYNAITGYLMPDVIENNLAVYKMSVFKK